MFCQVTDRYDATRSDHPAPFAQQDLALVLYYAAHHHPRVEVVCKQQQQQQQQRRQ
jgi:hypothetical protein